MFTAGTIAQLHSDPSCAGQITEVLAIRGGRVLYEVLLEDGSDRRMLTEAQLDASICAPNPSGNLAADRGVNQGLLRNTPLRNLPADRLP